MGKQLFSKGFGCIQPSSVEVAHFINVLALFSLLQWKLPILLTFWHYSAFFGGSFPFSEPFGIIQPSIVEVATEERYLKTKHLENSLEFCYVNVYIVL